jgi:hypothetical protein
MFHPHTSILTPLKESNRPQWFYPAPSKGVSLVWFVIGEDVDGTATVKVFFGERSGANIERIPGKDPVDLVNIANALNGAPAGYYGTMSSINGDWIPISTYECIAMPPCSLPGGSSFPAPSLPDGSVGVAYPPTVIAGTAVTIAVSGLPDGLTFNGVDTVSGTPTTAKTYYVSVSASAGGCTKTKLLEVEIV